MEPAGPVVSAAFAHVSTWRPFFCSEDCAPVKAICEGVPRTGTHGPDSPVVVSVTTEAPWERPGMVVWTWMYPVCPSPRFWDMPKVVPSYTSIAAIRTRWFSGRSDTVSSVSSFRSVV